MELERCKILVTGVAGFIGANLVCKLLRDIPGIDILGIDNMNDYYDVEIKKYRLEKIYAEKGKFQFKKVNIADKNIIIDIFREYQPDVVVNLAAQAGVRYSIENPDVYIESNIIGFYNILEACKISYSLKNKVKHLVYASSSSVYGANEKIPYSTDDKVDKPVSLYAATKKSDELIAHAYSKLYDIPCTGLRFFTVYGPAGRPDMAYFGFADKLRRGEKIRLFNYGNCQRDFTYIDDIVEGIIRVIKNPPIRSKGDNGLPIPPYEIYNIGNNKPENLKDFVEILKNVLVAEKILSKDFVLEDYIDLVPMQPGDVEITYADIEPFEAKFGYKPQTSLENGLKNFAIWYKQFYNL